MTDTELMDDQQSSTNTCEKMDVAEVNDSNGLPNAVKLPLSSTATAAAMKTAALESTAVPTATAEIGSVPANAAVEGKQPATAATKAADSNSNGVDSDDDDTRHQQQQLINKVDRAAPAVNDTQAHDPFHHLQDSLQKVPNSHQRDCEAGNTLTTEVTTTSNISNGIAINGNHSQNVEEGREGSHNHQNQVEIGKKCATSSGKKRTIAHPKQQVLPLLESRSMRTHKPNSRYFSDENEITPQRFILFHSANRQQNSAPPTPKSQSISAPASQSTSPKSKSQSVSSQLKSRSTRVHKPNSRYFSGENEVTPQRRLSRMKPAEKEEAVVVENGLLSKQIKKETLIAGSEHTAVSSIINCDESKSQNRVGRSGGVLQPSRPSNVELDVAESISEQQPPKRKRGRPRLSEVRNYSQSTNDEPNLNQVSDAKGQDENRQVRRGRPRKYPRYESTSPMIEDESSIALRRSNRVAVQNRPSFALDLRKRVSQDVDKSATNNVSTDDSKSDDESQSDEDETDEEEEDEEGEEDEEIEGEDEEEQLQEEENSDNTTDDDADIDMEQNDEDESMSSMIDASTSEVNLSANRSYRKRSSRPMNIRNMIEHLFQHPNDRPVSKSGRPKGRPRRLITLTDLVDAMKRNRSGKSLFSDESSNCQCYARFETALHNLHDWHKMEFSKLKQDNLELNVRLAALTNEAEMLRSRLNQKHNLSGQLNEIDQLKYIHQAEVVRTKLKQWCSSCLNEAYYFCCWNTSYCSPDCQYRHWYNGHKESCRRRKKKNSSTAQKVTSSIDKSSSYASSTTSSI